MPSGKRLATITKKSSAVATSLRRRKASKRSRQMSVRAMASTLARREIQHARPRVDAGGLVRRVDDAAAGAKMAGDQFLGVAPPGYVPCREGLIQQPQRHRLRQQPAREAPAGREREGKPAERPPSTTLALQLRRLKHIDIVAERPTAIAPVRATATNLELYRYYLGVFSLPWRLPCCRPSVRPIKMPLASV